jgi:hypothetical protein
MKRQIISVICVLCALGINAQISEKTNPNYVYPQKEVPSGIDNYLFSTYYFNGKKTYNLRGAVMSSTAPVSNLKINPSGSSFAVIERKGKEGDIQIFDLWKSDKILMQ